VVAEEALLVNGGQGVDGDQEAASDMANADIKCALQDRAWAAIWAGTTWLSTEDIGHACQARLADLINARRLFAIEDQGKTLFPAYVFNTAGEPVPQLQDILHLFHDYSPCRIGGWFESTSSALGGKRPREVLHSSPGAVVEAARAHVRGPQHN
jgi:hypothetical protein